MLLFHWTQCVGCIVLDKFLSVVFCWTVNDALCWTFGKTFEVGLYWKVLTKMHWFGNYINDVFSWTGEV